MPIKTRDGYDVVLMYKGSVFYPCYKDNDDTQPTLDNYYKVDGHILNIQDQQCDLDETQDWDDAEILRAAADAGTLVSFDGVSITEPLANAEDGPYTVMEYMSSTIDFAIQDETGNEIIMRTFETSVRTFETGQWDNYAGAAEGVRESCDDEYETDDIFRTHS